MKIKLIGLALIFLTAVSASAAPLSEPAQLRTQLPANALGYLRIPSPWGVLSTPKGTVLNEALADEKHQAQLRKLIEGLSQNVLKQAEPYIHPLLALLLERLRSPIEIVSLLAEDAPPQMANVLLRAKLDLASLAEANALLPKLIAGAPLEIGRPFSEDGHAMLVSPQGALLLHYDPAQKIFSAMTGLVATPDEFRRVLASLAPVERHPMHVLEEQIDASAQGLFAWLNLQRLLPLLRAAIPPEEWANWDKFGLSQARAMAYGLGVSRGKTRLKLLIDSPRSGLLALAPKIENRLSLTASGRPDAVFALNAPAAALLQSYEQFAKAQAEADPQMLAALVQLKSAFQAQTGMALEEALGAFGNEVVAFIDAAGEYAAIRIDDRARWEKLLNWLTTAFELRHEVREIEGRVYHHLQTPGFMSLQASPVDTPAQAFWREVLARVATHYYWVEEGDYLILGQTPQILFDRARHAEHIPIGDWLAQSQKLDYRSAVLLLSFSIDKTPRRLYYTYLQLLNALGDMAQTEFDLFALPSAAELRLPAVGGYGLQVFLGEDLLGAELAFENNPAEFLWALQGDAATGLALAGILAAIAIPAYHDYLTRAKVAEGLALLNGLKGPAEAYFAAQGRLPEAEELAEMGVSLSGEHTEVIFLLDDGSGYAATFDDPAIGGWLLLFYDPASGVWECGYDEMPEKFVPAACR